MANILAAQSGNWSDPLTWTGGVLPGANDIAVGNNKTVVIDQDIDVMSLNGSSFYINSVPIEGRTISADIGEPIHTRCLYINITSGTVNIFGKVNGGRNDQSNGVYFAASGSTLNVYGNIAAYGGRDDNSAILCNYAATINIYGDVYSSQEYSQGMRIVGPCSVTVTGNVVSYGSRAIHSANSSTTIDVFGDVVASTQDNAIYATGLNNLVRTLVDAPNGRKAILAPGWRLPQGELCTETITSDLFETPFSPGSQVVLSNYVSDSPPPSDVRAGKTYGPDGTLVGTMAVPASTQVADGVLVDNTSGTAAIRLSDVADVFGSQVTAVSNG